ncbi:MAG: hypothetical protein U0X39_04470 [Bacteroidales bacterium]
MKRYFITVVLFLFLSLTAFSQSIVADHTVVDKFNNIPQYYIDKIKQMWVSFPGESHSQSYRTGCELLEGINSKFQVNVTESGTPEAATSAHLRISRATWGDYTYSSGWRIYMERKTGLLIRQQLQEQKLVCYIVKTRTCTLCHGFCMVL